MLVHQPGAHSKNQHNEIWFFSAFVHLPSAVTTYIYVYRDKGDTGVGRSSLSLVDSRVKCCVCVCVMLVLVYRRTRIRAYSSNHIIVVDVYCLLYVYEYTSPVDNYFEYTSTP